MVMSQDTSPSRKQSYKGQLGESKEAADRESPEWITWWSEQTAASKLRFAQQKTQSTGDPRLPTHPTWPPYGARGHGRNEWVWDVSIADRASVLHCKLSQNLRQYMKPLPKLNVFWVQLCLFVLFYGSLVTGPICRQGWKNLGLINKTRQHTKT